MKCHRSLVPSSPCILEEALGDLVREPAVPVPPLEPPGRGPKKGRTPTRRQIQRHEERLGQLVRAISKAAGSPLLLIPGAEHASVSEPPACSQPVLICSDRKEVGDGGGHKFQDDLRGGAAWGETLTPTEHTLISARLRGDRWPCQCSGS